MFVANSYIEIGQELLFDYNDRQSRLPFLRSCPICNEQSAATSKRQQLPDATESQPAAKRLNVDSSGSSASSANSVVPSLATASTSATAGAESTPSTAASTAPAGKRFSAKAMTRSAVESWLPGINSRSVDYVMQRRNADACNAFKLKLRRVDDDDDDVEDE